ncbi:MAG: hypothetical protein QM756_07940 [Polyangiaceae bacterium]
MSSLKDDFAALRNQARANWREASADFTRIARPTPTLSFEELNPAVAKPVPPPWETVWKRYYLHRAIVLGAFLCVPFGSALAAMIYQPLAGFVALIGFGTFVYAALWLTFFACPRCGRPFGTIRRSERSRVSSGHPRRCMYCGLTIGTRS